LRSGKTSRPWQLTQPPQNKPRQFSDECEVEFPAAVDWAAKLQRLQFGSEVSQHWIAVPSEMSLFKYKRSMDELIPLTMQKTDQLCGIRVHRFSAELAFEVGVRPTKNHSAMRATIAHPTPMPIMKYRHLFFSSRICQANAATTTQTNANIK
jgi:hypothetical protein